MRDLEIRGAGNLLGAEQSGHISAIGFGLYCQLLQQTVARQNGEDIPVPANVEMELDFVDFSVNQTPEDNTVSIPYDYIEDENLRIAIYRQMSKATSTEHVTGIRDDLLDRFGPLPPSTNRLLNMALIRVACAEAGIQKIETRADKLMLTRNGKFLKRGTLFPRLKSVSADDRLEEILEHIGSWG